jgi:hypothetical protein
VDPGAVHAISGVGSVALRHVLYRVCIFFMYLSFIFRFSFFHSPIFNQKTRAGASTIWNMRVGVRIFTLEALPYMA